MVFFSGGEGALKFFGSDLSDDMGNQGQITKALHIGVDAETLPNGNYVLSFGKEVCGNSEDRTLGKNVNFVFQVQWSLKNVKVTLSQSGSGLEKAVSARLEEGQSLEEIDKLTITTEDGYVLTDEDFAFIRDKLGRTLTGLDLGNVTLPEEQLPQGALKNCTALRELTLPESLRILRADSLQGCDSLEVLRLNSPQPPQVEGELKLPNLLRLIVPPKSEALYKEAEPWKNYADNVHVEVKSLSLNKETLEMAEGTSEVLTASILPEEASDQTIEWSSANPKIASVTDKGEVKALKTGKAVITATTADGGYEASCRVTVHTPPPVVKLDRESAQIYASGDDSAVQLNASVTGSEFWDEEDVMWESSAPSVAEVDDSGLVTGRAPGTAWILAKVGSQEAKCRITVKNHTITLDKRAVSLYAAGSGNTASLRVKIDGKSVSGSQAVWSSSRTSVAAVSRTGIVSGKSAGAAVVTASANGKSATCTIYVKAPTIRLNRSAATIYTKASRTVLLTATVNGVRVSGSRAAWSSSNQKVATVSRSGVVSARRKGTAVITARANGKSVSCRITVKNPTMRLTKKSARIKKGKKVRIRVKATPKGKVTYKSRNKKIATVSRKGVVKGRKKGVTKIRVTCNGVTKNFTVRVR